MAFGRLRAGQAHGAGKGSRSDAEPVTVATVELVPTGPWATRFAPAVGGPVDYFPQWFDRRAMSAELVAPTDAGVG